MVLAHRNGAHLQRNGARPIEPSAYLKYLPAFYSEDEFLGRFLRIFQSILDPIEGMLDNFTAYLDPRYCPKSLLPWIASWTDIPIDPAMPTKRLRKLLRQAVELTRWRGTRKGLADHLRLYAGVEPDIAEEIGGMVLGPKNILGWNTLLGGRHPNRVGVTLRLSDVDSVREDHVRQIIAYHLPAYAVYTLRIEPLEVPA